MPHSPERSESDELEVSAYRRCQTAWVNTDIDDNDHTNAPDAVGQITTQVQMLPHELTMQLRALFPPGVPAWGCQVLQLEEMRMMISLAMGRLLGSVSMQARASRAISSGHCSGTL